MNYTQLINDPSNLSQSLWADAYSKAFCDFLDEGMDPGMAAEKVDGNLLNYILHPITMDELDQD